MIIFSLGTDSNGNLSSHGIDSRTNTKELVARLGDLGISTSACIGGWADKIPFKDVVVDDVKRARLVDGLVRYCLENDLGGIDFDWEFPKTQEQKDGYANLILETKDLLPGKNISIAMSSHYSFGSRRENLRVFNAVDWVGIMSYDRGGRHSLYSDSLKDIKTFQDRGVVDSKIVLGLPFYGRNIEKFSNTRTYAYISTTTEDLASEQDHHVEVNPRQLEQERVYFYNGKNTILRKFDAAFHLGIGGIMIWELGQDNWEAEESITRLILARFHKLSSIY